jgi:hypothetical protein
MSLSATVLPTWPDGARGPAGRQMPDGLRGDRQVLGDHSCNLRYRTRNMECHVPKRACSVRNVTCRVRRSSCRISARNCRAAEDDAEGELRPGSRTSHREHRSHREAFFKEFSITVFASLAGLTTFAKATAVKKPAPCTAFFVGAFFEKRLLGAFSVSSVRSAARTWTGNAVRHVIRTRAAAAGHTHSVPYPLIRRVVRARLKALRAKQATAKRR